MFKELIKKYRIRKAFKDIEDMNKVNIRYILGGKNNLDLTFFEEPIALRKEYLQELGIYETKEAKDHLELYCQALNFYEED